MNLGLLRRDTDTGSKKAINGSLEAEFIALGISN